MLNIPFFLFRHPLFAPLPGSVARNMANVSNDTHACGRVPPLTRHHGGFRGEPAGDVLRERACVVVSLIWAKRTDAVLADKCRVKARSSSGPSCSGSLRGPAVYCLHSAAG